MCSESIRLGNRSAPLWCQRPERRHCAPARIWANRVWCLVDDDAMTDEPDRWCPGAETRRRLLPNRIFASRPYRYGVRMWGGGHSGILQLGPFTVQCVASRISPIQLDERHQAEFALRVRPYVWGYVWVGAVFVRFVSFRNQFDLRPSCKFWAPNYFHAATGSPDILRIPAKHEFPEQNMLNNWVF